MCLTVDTPDEADKSLPDDDLQKNLAFLLDRVEGCSVFYLLPPQHHFYFHLKKVIIMDGTEMVQVTPLRRTLVFSP